MNVKTSNLLTLLAIAAIFLAPIGTSYYLNSIGWQPDKIKNKGHLLAKAVPMENRSFTQAGGENLTLEKIKHTWVMVYIGGKDCSQTCEKRLDELQRVHIALGKNQKRVKLMYLDTSANASASKNAKDLLEKYIVLTSPAESVNGWKTQFDSLVEGNESADMIFIIDPLGNAMMYYRKDEAAIGIRKDMGRLLHVSRIG